MRRTKKKSRRAKCAALKGPVLAITAVVGGLMATSAAGQSTTFGRVSITGADSGNCTTNPCRTMQYAVNQANVEGRIICESSGNFGSVTINRSVNIDCSSHQAFLREVVINDTLTPLNDCDVYLRGLTIELLDNDLPVGISFISGNSLVLENVRIVDFASTAASRDGIRFFPTLASRLHISNSMIANNGGPGGAGVNIRPIGSGYAAVTIDNVQFVGNRTGLEIDTGSASGASTNLVVSRSIFAGNQNGIAVTAFDDKPGVGLTLLDSTVNGSAFAGLNVRGSNALVRLSRSTVSGNSTGLERSFGGVIATYGNNSLIGNGVNGSFNGFPTEN